MDSVKMVGIATRGVNVVSAPTEIGLEEVTSAQNAEVVTDAGMTALDKRPGMSRINASPMSGAVLLAKDIPADVLFARTPTLYAGMYAGATHNWRKSVDGTTWTDADTPVKPFSHNASIAGFFKNIPKCVTVGRKMFFVDASSPINLHSWDGVTDAIATSIPPAVSGTVLATPTVYPTDSSGWIVSFNGSTASTTYSYVFVAVAGTAHSAASSVGSFTLGSASLDSSNYVVISIDGTPPAGATQVDVYRTVGGATQGKIGTVPISAGAYTRGNGSGDAAPHSPLYVFTDKGLVGDGTTAPVSASGSTAGDALGVLDMVTDGTSLYLAVLDQAASDPLVYGRVLQYSVGGGVWTQIGLSFPLALGNGGPSALLSYDGAFVFGTYIGTTSGNTSYLAGLGTPTPAGGFPETHTTATSQATCCLAVFNGVLYAGYVSLIAGTAAVVVKRTPVATWATSLTAPATAQYNAFTSLAVFNGRLFAGWTSGAGATAANIKSTLDGTTWTAEITLGVGEVVGQMVTFGGNLYVVCGRTGASYNTITRILKRDTSGTWTAVDDPSDDFAGCLGVVYV